MTTPARILLSSFVTLVAVACSLSPSHALPPQPEAETAFLDDIFIPRRPIPYELLGINAFANESAFGSIPSQLREVRSTLRLRPIRVLILWNEGVQASPSAAPNFSLYDQIINSLPRGSQALLILTGAPSWLRDSRTWIGGDPRRTFAEMWARTVAKRYGRNRNVEGFQVWNEPNNPDFAENETMEVLNSPTNYVELLAVSQAAIRSVAPRKKVINAATTAIAQNYPATLNYNKEMVNAGLLSFTDAFAIHYYGKNYDRMAIPGGVGDFLKGISKPVWVTESGAQGVNKQREYAQRIFPFLKSSIPALRRIYIYQFTESTPADTTYGLRNLTPGRSVSDLYIDLRDRP